MFKPIGEPLNQSPPEEVTLDSDELPGLEFRLSNDTIKDIEEIETNIRTAEQRSGMIVLRG
ncbi:MAG: hypothetical protein AB7S71_08190 [Dongiaceae bacterium]